MELATRSDADKQPEVQLHVFSDPDPDTDDATSLSTIEQPSHPTEYHPLSLPVLALLAPASMFGTLARLGLQSLATYDGQGIFPLAYVQAVGCLVMGYGLGVRESFTRFYSPLYTALTAGFCGSLTTFSGWQLDVFDSWLNTGEFHRSSLRDAFDGIGKIALTLTLSLASVSFGIYLSAITSHLFPTLSIPSRTARYTLTLLAVLIYAASFPAYFWLPRDFRHQATAALLFAYPGAVTRYLLSVRLNGMIKSFPLGTFLANAFGTALLGMFHVFQSTPHPPSHGVCALLQGLSDGYCGCLTTVSTFAVEVMALRRWKVVRYVLVSIIASQILLLVILGPSFWRGHVKKKFTCTFD